MRSRQLDTALTSFMEEASCFFQQEIDAGAEVPFELATKGLRGGQTPLYCYEPLTNAFIVERLPTLKGLAGYEAALVALVAFEGLDRYLQSRSVNSGRADRRVRAAAALRVLVEDVFAQQTSFELRPERLQQALQALEGSASLEANELTLIATLHGMTIGSPELVLAPGLSILRPEGVPAIPDAALQPEETHGGEHLLVAFRADGVGISSPALDDGTVVEGCEVLRELLRALRLFGDGRVTLGGLAWSRVGGGSWRALALGLGGRPHGMLVVGAEQEDELRAFCNLVSRRRPRDNELAWALERYELGCERRGEYEALSDYLLALRALLAPSHGGASEETSDGLLAGRLAALCATPERRAQLSEHVLQALALERAVIAGTAVEHAGDLALVRDLADHLRALLRDVICGHLEHDLVSLADALLLQDSQIPAVEVEDAEGDPWETDQLSLAGLPG